MLIKKNTSKEWISKQWTLNLPCLGFLMYSKGNKQDSWEMKWGFMNTCFITAGLTSGCWQAFEAHMILSIVQSKHTSLILMPNLMSSYSLISNDISSPQSLFRVKYFCLNYLLACGLVHLHSISKRRVGT